MATHSHNDDEKTNSTIDLYLVYNNNLTVKEIKVTEEKALRMKEEYENDPARKHAGKLHIVMVTVPIVKRIIIPREHRIDHRRKRLTE